ncbi:secreted immunoglobulin domain 1 [Perca fluviatilis]|uniref:secreted immunoglobulin domain 1 n=1 Tax=Perca fluviatilis TaxID=8168 RepID=UPI00196359F6|nr:secreted immunoglobulin domain 1 [Perca fluviatilis]
MESELVALILLSLSGVWCWPATVATPTVAMPTVAPPEPTVATPTVTTPTMAPPAPGVLVRVGENATLRCPLLDAAEAPPQEAAKWTVSWYRKWAGRPPQLLLSFRLTAASNVTYGAGLGPEKVSAAADSSLLLTDSTHGDSAFYYCSMTQGEGGGKQ